MPLDPWRRAHDREVCAHARAEFAAEGKTSYPRVWAEADLERLAVTDSPGEEVRRRAAWAVVDARGRVLRLFTHAQVLAAKRHAVRVQGSAVRVKVPMADWE